MEVSLTKESQRSEDQQSEQWQETGWRSGPDSEPQQGFTAVLTGCKEGGSLVELNKINNLQL